MQVLLGASTQEIASVEDGLRLTFADGSTLDTDMVVFSFESVVVKLN